MIIRIEPGKEPRTCVVEAPNHKRPKAFRNKQDVIDFVSVQVDLYLEPPDPAPPTEYPEGTKPISNREIYKEADFSRHFGQVYDVLPKYTPSHLLNQYHPQFPLYKAEFTCFSDGDHQRWKGRAYVHGLDDYEYIPQSDAHKNAHEAFHYEDFRNGLSRVSAAIKKHYNNSLTEAVVEESRRDARETEIKAAFEDVTAFREISDYRGQLP